MISKRCFNGTPGYLIMIMKSVKNKLNLDQLTLVTIFGNI